MIRIPKRKPVTMMIKLRHPPTILILWLATAWVSAPTARAENSEVPKEAQGVGIDQQLGAELPLDLPAVDSRGRKLRLAQFFDGRRPVLVTLNYSDCPMLCNVQLGQLVQSLDQLQLNIGEDFQIVTVSIDPKETPQRSRETKAKYIEQLPNQPGADAGWHFLTMSEASIKKLADSMGFRYRYDKLSKEYYHPAMLAFVSPEGVITRYSLDVAFPPDQVKLALVESSEGKIGSAVDQFLLLCFAYDPERNRYTASAWRLMRLGGLATIGLLLVTLTPFWFGRRLPRGGDDPSPEESAAAESASSGHGL